MADLPYIGTTITGPSGNDSNDFELKVGKGAPNGYAPLDASAKVPTANLPDQASLDAEVDVKITTHNSATTSVHGIANTANLVLTNDSRLSNPRNPTAHTHAPSEITGTAVVTNDARLSDPRRPLPFPILSETLFTGVRAEKRVHTRSYNSVDNYWYTTTVVTQLPLVSDTYYDSEAIYAFGEVNDDTNEWYIDKSPSVAFGTSPTSGLIVIGSDEGEKVIKLGTIVIPPLPTPAPAPPYTTQATFTESFSMTLTKARGERWYTSTFATNWDVASPSKNILLMDGSINGGIVGDNDVLDDWKAESDEAEVGDYAQWQAEMASTNILLRCSKRYTSFTNGASPSVEGNGNIIVEIIFYGIPQLGFGTTAGTFCQGNDSRISGIAGNKINIGVYGGSITSNGYGGNINTGGYGGSIDTSGYGGTLNLSDHGGSITTGPYGGAINTTGQGSIELGSTTQGNPAGTAYGRTILKGSASGNSPQTITLPNATGTVALTNDTRLSRPFRTVFATTSVANASDTRYFSTIDAVGPVSQLELRNFQLPYDFKVVACSATIYNTSASALAFSGGTVAFNLVTKSAHTSTSANQTHLLLSNWTLGIAATGMVSNYNASRDISISAGTNLAIQVVFTNLVGASLRGELTLYTV